MRHSSFRLQSAVTLAMLLAVGLLQQANHP